MKYFRIFYTLLLWILALLSLLALLAIAPLVQTWALKLALAGDSGLHGSVEAVSIRFGKVQAANLRLEKDGGILKVPSFQARMPISTALFRKKVALERLVAKGWTLDLTARAKPAASVGGADGKAELQEALAFLHGALSGWKLPVDLSAEEVELEGDILTISEPGGAPATMHVILKGGALGEGRDASFDFDVIGQFFGANLRMPYVATHGKLSVRMDSPRSFERFGAKAKLVVRSEAFQKDIDWDLDGSVARGVGEESYALDISQAQRKIAALTASVPSPVGNIQGHWTATLRGEDLAPFANDRFPSQLTLDGEGRFEADAALAGLRLTGKIKGDADGLGKVAAPLAALGSTGFDVRFEVRHAGERLHVEQLELSLGGERPAAIVRALQSFDLDETKREIRLSEPGADWFEVRLEEAPLAWLKGVTGDYSLEGSGLKGILLVRRTDQGLGIRSSRKVEAGRVVLKHDAAVVFRNLDLAFGFSGESASGSWKLRFSPFEAGSAGHPVASAEGAVSLPSKAGQPPTVSASWKLDLRALSGGEVVPGFAWAGAKSAAGDLEATLGDTTNLQGKLEVAYDEAGRSLALSGFKVEFRPNSAFFFTAPFKVSLPEGGADLTLEGAWYAGEPGRPLSAKISSPDCAPEYLKELALPIAALRGGSVSTGASGLPFWGEWTGYLSFVFERFRAWGQDMHDARWTVNLEPRAAKLQNASWQGSDKVLQMWTGSIAFDPSAEDRYALEASASLGEVDSSSLFGKSSDEKDPLFVGRFSLAKKLRGRGSDAEDLWKRVEEEYSLESKGGIVRLLKTNVADALPVPSTPGSDMLGAVGDVVGPIFGRRSGTVGHRQVKLRKNTEAILNFSYDMAEFRYEQLKIKASRGMDRVLNIEEFSLSSPDLKIAGSGKLVPAGAEPLQEQSLSADLRFSVAGRGADFLIEGGLVAAQKDAQGFVEFPQAVHFGGTLLKLDKTQWHDILAAAANADPDAKKKAAEKK